MKLALQLALVGMLALSAAAYSRTVSYEGQKVYRCPAKNRYETEAYLKLAEHYFLDVWEIDGGYADIRVTAEQLQKIPLRLALTPCSVAIDDVEAYVRDFEKSMEPKAGATWFEEYHNYNDTFWWYQGLATTYPHLATFIPSIGKTIEGRDLFGFIFTSSIGSNKPTIFFQCQIHAREWISGATCGYVINHLLANYGRDSAITHLLDNVRFVVNVIQNPDGYEYTWNNDRLWRKNRNPNGSAGCAGVDLNRNYADHWGQGGSSSLPCSDTYMGSSAGSELEVKASVAFFKQYAPVIGAIDWHAYSQLILRPYGWTRSDSPDEARLKQLGDGMASAIRSVHGMSYTSQKSIDLYVTTGTASDWFYGDEATAANKGYRAAGYTIELRDTGRYGFRLPPEQIIPSGEENLAAVIYFVTELIRSPILNK